MSRLPFVPAQTSSAREMISAVSAETAVGVSDVAFMRYISLFSSVTDMRDSRSFIAPAASARAAFAVSASAE